MNVTVPSMKMGDIPQIEPERVENGSSYVVARYTLNGIQKESKIRIPGDGRISVGRTGESSLVLDDASVSKMHASIVAGDSNQIFVADTGSTNGTFINGQRLAYGTSVECGPNDRLKFGTVDVSIERIDQEVDRVDGIMERSDPPETTIDGFQFRSRSPEETTESESQNNVSAEATPDEWSDANPQPASDVPTDLRTQNEGAEGTE